jgi:mannose-6-phosphate isomerase
MMDEYEEFPLTIALVDASESLSIQVHPDDIVAERIEGEKIGKMESWIFLEKPNSDWIYAGCVCDSKKDLEFAVMNNRVEEMVGRLQIGQNDYVYIEAGILHAMTAGSLVYEIEYGSDYTYRFYDYNRIDEKGYMRELHIDKGMEAVKLEIQPKIYRNVGEQWISEEKYEIRKVEYIDRYENTSNKVECIVLLEGNGVLEGCKMSGGIGILLLPEEKLEEINIRSGIIARVR